MKRQLKQSVVYGLYALSFILLISGIAILGFAVRRKGNDDFQYVSKGILDYEEKVPVVNTDIKILRPYTDKDVKLVKSFYDYKSDASEQEKSLIYFEGTYIQSSGVAYSNGEVFDVVAIYDGKVKEIKEDITLGNVIIIEHENGVISVYQSVSDIAVKQGDNVVAGELIAKSSTSNISTDLGNHLYFELIIDGVCVNPENYYDKLINEL
jgi:stage II sporulation protein Q